MLVPAADGHAAQVLEAISDIVKTEVNVKRLEIVASDNEVFVKRVDPDFKKLGPKFGKQMKQAAAMLKALDRNRIAELERDGHIVLDIDGTEHTVDIADVKIISEDIPGWLVANEDALTVALDIDITPELFREGLAREIINRVQNLRKKRGYDITDHIVLRFLPGPEIDDVIKEYGDYIATQVLADAVTVADTDNSEIEILDIDDLKLGTVITLS